MNNVRDDGCEVNKDTGFLLFKRHQKTILGKIRQAQGNKMIQEHSQEPQFPDLSTEGPGELISNVASAAVVTVDWTSVGLPDTKPGRRHMLCSRRASLADVSILFVFCLFSSRSKHVL